MNVENKIRRMIACGESSTVQFKREFTSQTQMAAEMIAFANCKGGTLLIGVEDKTGEVTGLDYAQIRRTNTELSNTANEQGNELKVVLWKTVKKAASKSESDQVKATSKSESDQVKAASKSQSDQVKATSKRERTISKILSYCSEPRTMKDIMDYLGLTDRGKLKNRYLNPLLGISLKMTQPNSPKSPTQRYVVIDYPLNND